MKTQENFDITIIGGDMVGESLALRLAGVISASFAVRATAFLKVVCR